MRGESPPSVAFVIGGGNLGAVAWAAYGVAEFGVLGPLSALTLASHLYRPIHWATVALAAVVYPVLGFGLAVVGMGLWGRLGRAIPALDQVRPAVARRGVAILSLAVAADASAVAGFGWRRPALVVALVSVAASLILLVAALRRRGAAVLDGLALGLLLTGTAWIQREVPPLDLGRSLLALLLFAVTVFLAGAGLRLGVGARGRLGLSAGFHIGAYVLLASVCGHLKPTPLVATGSPRLGPLVDLPSIVLITMDTVRADHLGLYGYGRRTSPHLEDLARGSTVYANALSTGDMTLSSHASLFTGRYAFAHGARPPAEPLADREVTLAEILAERGYRTAAVVANTVYLRAVLGLAQGFQHYDQRIPARLAGAPPRGYLGDVVGRWVEPWIPKPWLLPHYRQATEVTDEALGLLELARRDGRPLLLFVNYMDAHTPYLPPPPWDSRFPGKDPEWAWATHRALKRRMAQGPVSVPPEVRAHLVSQYDGAIAFVDAEIGRLVGLLRKLGLFENSMVIVTSDHGEAFGEHGLLEHGISVYQNQVHVPLLIKFPRSREAQVIPEWVSGADVLPTILEVIGAEPRPEVQGQSLLRPPAGRGVLCESFQPRTTIRGFVAPDGLKLIAGEGLPSRMFDLRADPHEVADLAPRESGQVADLALELHRFLGAKVQPRPPGRVIDPGTLEELRALGYVR